MAQREALTRLLHGLHLEGPLQQSRNRLVDHLDIGASLQPEQYATRLVDDPDTFNPDSDTIDVAGFLQVPDLGDYEFDPTQAAPPEPEFLETEPPTVDTPEVEMQTLDLALLGRTPIAPRSGNAQSTAVSADTKLDFLLELSAQLHEHTGSAQQLQTLGNENTLLHDVAESVLRSPTAPAPTADQVSALLRAIDQVGPSLQPTVTWHGPGAVRSAEEQLPLHQAHNEVLRLLAQDPATQALATALRLPFGFERVQCNASLVRVDLDGRGDFAVFIETITTVDTTRAPQIDGRDLVVADFTGTLTHPEAFFDTDHWPSCNSFWRQMVRVDAANPAGTCGGERLTLEQVGDEHNADWLPLTLLCFERQTRDDASADPFRLTYRLIRDPDDIAAAKAQVPGLDDKQQALAFDDGAIVVREYDNGAGNQIEVRITKVVLLNGFNLRSEGQSMATLICQSGWGDQTRDFITNCIYGGA